MRKPYTEQVWETLLDTLSHIDFKKVYLKKITSMADKKLTDINYKILHMILPCGYSLSRWKLISSDKCILCNEKNYVTSCI